MGVTKTKYGTWRARFQQDGVPVSVGCFASERKAQLALNKVKRAYNEQPAVSQYHKEKQRAKIRPAQTEYKKTPTSPHLSEATRQELKKPKLTERIGAFFGKATNKQES